MCRILFLDDDKNWGLVMQKLLNLEGFECDALTDGEIAYARILNPIYDVLITDLAMPDLDGLTLIKYIRKISSIPIIVLSAYDDLKMILEEKVDGYFIKPVTPSTEIWNLFINTIKQLATNYEKVSCDPGLCAWEGCSREAISGR